MREKLLFIISSLNTGGAQAAMAKLSLALSKDYEIDWILNSDENIIYDYRGNIHSLKMAEPKDRSSYGYILKTFFKRLSVIGKMKKKGGYKACISFLDSANIANVMTGRHGSKIILSQRSSFAGRPEKKRSPLVLFVDKFFYKKADAVVAVSQGVRKELIDLFGLKEDRVFAINNGFDNEKILSMKGEETSDFVRQPGKFYFVNVGRLDYPKGQWHLIRAFSKVAKVSPQAQLIIIGDGAEEEYLKSLISGLGLEERVSIMPFRENPFQIMGRCDAFVFSSLYEGFSNAIVEGLICGLPCISTDHRSGAREILAPHTPFFYQTFDKEEDAEFGILVPVCSGTRHDAAAPLEKEEEILGDAMINMLKNPEIKGNYKYAAKQRGLQFDLYAKGGEWKDIIEA